MFFQSYPSSTEAMNNLNYDLVTRILSLCSSDFYISPNEFDILKSIESERLNFPFEISLSEYVGKALRNGKGASGVYLFTNKLNGERYIGSSINLASRLKNGYFGKLPLIGQRKIEKAIREYGLANFYLDVFLLPDSIKSSVSSSESSNSEKNSFTLPLLVFG